MDLQQPCSIHVIQVNYAENDTRLKGRSPGIYYQYLLEYSTDNKTWKTLADKTQNTTDVPHDYIELSRPVKARYVRLTNYRVPGGTFALAGLRLFGNAGGKAPATAENIRMARREDDRCVVQLRWAKPAGAVGYNIRYGTARDKLYQTWQVLGTDSVTIGSLNSLQKYYFTIDTFNENGVTTGKKVLELN
jgi:hypothetical protein